jgi:hypothetical protein
MSFGNWSWKLARDKLKPGPRMQTYVPPRPLRAPVNEPYVSGNSPKETNDNRQTRGLAQ